MKCKLGFRKFWPKKPAALTIHGRIANRGYATPADWDPIKEVVELAKGSDTVIIGNGDVWNYQNGLERAEKSGVDGVMIGRAALKIRGFLILKPKWKKFRFRTAVICFSIT